MFDLALSNLQKSPTPECVLMFSGGRDSTLSALRLAEAGVELTLVTISSQHLHGMNAVRRRLAELSSKLPSTTRWLIVEQPEALATDTTFYKKTCLPCHHAYVVVAVAVAAMLRTKKLSFGYTRYQDSWPEQSSLAVSSLGALLKDIDVELILPVHNLASKQDAKNELLARGVSSEALEQKCSLQVNNVVLPQDILKSQITLWEHAIRHSIEQIDQISIKVIADTTMARLFEDVNF